MVLKYTWWTPHRHCQRKTDYIHLQVRSCFNLFYKHIISLFFEKHWSSLVQLSDYPIISHSTHFNNVNRFHIFTLPAHSIDVIILRFSSNFNAPSKTKISQLSVQELLKKRNDRSVDPSQEEGLHTLHVNTSTIVEKISVIIF